MGVLAENSLPFTMAPVFIDVAKALARDQRALDNLSMDRTSASYKMRFGLGLSFHNETLENLRQHKFSLNIDESTSNNEQKVFAVLASYFDPKRQLVVIEHLSSISVIRVNSQSLLEELENIFSVNQIPWNNLMSILMDSCNVMRGSKSGLEVRLREKFAPHLLDIDGDICHHIHNASKQLCKPFGYWVEELYSKIHADFKYSTDLREALSNICQLLGVKFTMPERFISHRWLSCYDVSVGTIRMWDPLTVFYFAFLPQDDRVLYQSILTSIYKQRDLSKEAEREIKLIQKDIGSKAMTEDGKKRKELAIKKIFYKRKQTRCIMHFYSASLPLLKQYVCLFETSSPMVHKLHDRQVELFRDFLSCFMKPEVYASMSVKNLKNELKIDKENNLIDQREMFIGKITSSIIASSHRQDSTVNSFLKNVQEAYVKCGQYLQKKLPLNNTLLRSLSALDPLARQHSLTSKYLRKLPLIVTNVLSEDAEMFDLEARRFQSNNNLPSAHDKDGKEVRLDSWWADVEQGNQFPSLCRMAFALMSVFHGPAVEGSFNTMGDILDPKSSRMNISTYSSIQTVKYGLRAKGKSALDLFSRKDVLYDPVYVPVCRNLCTSRKKYSDEQAGRRKVAEEKRQKLSLKAQQLQSKLRAKEALCKAEKAARLAHKRKMESRLDQLVVKRRK